MSDWLPTDDGTVPGLRNLVRVLKVRISANERNRQRLTLRLQHCERELKVLQESNSNDSKLVASSQQRQNMLLRRQCTHLEKEVHRLKNSSSHTSHIELQIKSEEYYAEIQRLRGLLRKLGYKKESPPSPIIKMDNKSNDLQKEFGIARGWKTMKKTKLKPFKIPHKHRKMGTDLARAMSETKARQRRSKLARALTLQREGERRRFSSGSASVGVDTGIDARTRRLLIKHVEQQKMELSKSKLRQREQKVTSTNAGKSKKVKTSRGRGNGMEAVRHLKEKHKKITKVLKPRTVTVTRSKTKEMKINQNIKALVEHNTLQSIVRPYPSSPKVVMRTSDATADVDFDSIVSVAKALRRVGIKTDTPGLKGEERLEVLTKRLKDFMEEKKKKIVKKKVEKVDQYSYGDASISKKENKKKKTKSRSSWFSRGKRKNDGDVLKNRKIADEEAAGKKRADEEAAKKKREEEAKKKREEEALAAARIQSVARGKRQRHRKRAKEKVAVHLQKYQRGNQGRKKYQEHRERRNKEEKETQKAAQDAVDQAQTATIAISEEHESDTEYDDGTSLRSDVDDDDDDDDDDFHKF
eukprot:g190.t1